MVLRASASESKHIEGLMKTFLDIIVLSMLNGTAIHGYKIIAEIHKSFGVLLSPGTLYPLLYHLMEENLITVEVLKRRKLYSLTSLGRRRVSKIMELSKRNSEKIFRFIDGNLNELPILVK